MVSWQPSQEANFQTASLGFRVRVTSHLPRRQQRLQAVERGRSEERVRIAQDLHDDIGARLLTLMYKASSPEMEDYLRHTLKDLKTLTRGLAAPSHPLSWAVAEWKAGPEGVRAVIGKRFALSRGIISFDGGSKIDPRLDILAEANASGVTAQAQERIRLLIGAPE